MAGFLGRAAAVGRRVPSMECALVCLLLTLSIIGGSTGLDRTLRSSASGLIADIYGEDAPAVRGVPIPKEAVARVQNGQPFSGVQARAARNP